MSRFGYLFCFALLLGDAISTRAQDANAKSSTDSNAPKASAVSSQPVHPVLIRNEHGPMTRVVVDVANGAEAVAKSFDFKMDGTDDLGDLESLSLFSTGDKEEFSSATNRNTLIEPNCNGSLLRVDYEAAGEKKHVLLFANPHMQKGRAHHTIQISFDDGQTWPKSHHLLLDEGRGAGYPSLTRVDDRHVGIVYEGSQSHLVFEKFSLDELLKR